MEANILWATLGGFVATVFNIFYNYIRESINRRWQVATEMAGTLDYYYERVVRLVAHQEAVHQDKESLLTKDEFRMISFEVGPALVDAQKSKIRLALVFGENSEEVRKYEEIANLIKISITKGMTVTHSGWVKELPELRQYINEINDKRQEFHGLLVNQSRLLSVLRQQLYIRKKPKL